MRERGNVFVKQNAVVKSSSLRLMYNFILPKGQKCAPQRKMRHIRLRKLIPFVAKTNWQVNTIQPACKVVHHPKNAEEGEECAVGPK